MRYCIRGMGVVGKRLSAALDSFGEICFADKNSALNCYSVSESIAEYRNKKIDKYVIALEYAQSIVLDVRDELLEGGISEKDILFATQANYSYGIKLITCEEYEYFRKKMLHSENYLDRSSSKFVICGFGWLQKYLMHILSEEQYVKYECLDKENCNKEGNLIYLICDANKYYYTFAYEHDFYMLYDLLMEYYFYYPGWFHMLCQMSKSCGSIKCIATGISYLCDGINHKKIINLANRGQDLKHDFAMCKKWYYDYSFKRQIDKLVIGLCPYSFQYSMEYSKMNRNLCKSYFPLDMDCYIYVKGFEKEKKWQEAESRIFRYIPEFDVQDCFYHFFVPVYGKVDYRCEIYAGENEEQDIQEICKMYQKPYEDTVVENRKIFEEYLGFATNESLRVFVVLMPYADIYRRYMDESYYKKTIDILKEYQKQFKFEIVDFTKIGLKNFYFYDSGHLNCYGSEIITEKLVTVLELES